MDDDAAIGKLVREYAENEGKLSSLERELKELGSPLSRIGGTLVSDPEMIRPVDEGLEDSRSTTNRVSLLALTKAHGLLVEYQAAVHSKGVMLGRFHGMGLQFIIPE